MTNIKDLPRERLIRLGAQGLTANELLQVLLRSGTKAHSVSKLASKVEQLWIKSSGNINLEDLTQIAGLGSAKACSILAALELGSRVARADGIVVDKPEVLLPLTLDIAHQKKEYLIMFCLNGNKKIISRYTVSVGILDSALVHPREVYADAITDRAAGIILLHNHPTGIAEPSLEDLEITQQLNSAGNILGIRLVDHIIITKQGEFFSFANQGMLN